MEAQDWIGVGVLSATVILTVTLLRLRLVRRLPVLMMAFLINPGMVGLAASLAFWLRDTSHSFYFWAAAMLLMIPSTLIVMMYVPKAMFKQIEAQQDDPPPKGEETDQPPAGQ